ncbi:Golgi-associated plant pathogenesis-related protein 1-like [Condylostylus longicornis]|uniref:Golgi-associated plant pathogenesis-related protein 1-like n=1 Tax=Condylostylus longicornis TaxID=2530218 RepID=UPI00244DC692|nr:Golgi-associated plant pathogenesis-related protein 1-like [Condylostylus longicornis]
MNLVEKEFLDEHNRLRDIHDCPPLRINNKLSELAQEWAQHLARKNILQYQKNVKYGQNVLVLTDTKINPKSIVQTWYNEIKKYNYDRSDGFSSGCGHFTQMIWKNSREIGIGYVQRNSNIFVVVNYDPPGNFIGQYNENVPKPKHSPTRLFCFFQ